MLTFSLLKTGALMIQKRKCIWGLPRTGNSTLIGKYLTLPEGPSIKMFQPCVGNAEQVKLDSNYDNCNAKKNPYY